MIRFIGGRQPVICLDRSNGTVGQVEAVHYLIHIFHELPQARFQDAWSVLH